jgi:hypothetical protein
MALPAVTRGQKKRIREPFSGGALACRVQLVPCETRNTQKGEATMLKNILVILGIAALTSGSAFAASKAPRTTPTTHKVARASEAKPARTKVAKADKKMKKGSKATEKAPTAAAPAEEAPAPAKK